MKKSKSMLGVVVAAFVLAFTALSVYAGEIRTDSAVPESEIVFLLDTSNSMNAQDKERLAIDAIRQAAHSLPSNFQTGLVTYNTGIQTISPLEGGAGHLDPELDQVVYSGYTNAGEGLEQAVTLFSDKDDVQRYIVMLSDGEIIMGDTSSTEVSRTMYVEAAERARSKGIKILIIAIGNELNNPRLHIFDGAAITDGAVYWEGQSGTLSGIMNRLSEQRFGYPREELSVPEGGGSIRFDVPSGVSRMKILLVSDGGINKVEADYTAEHGIITNGLRFAEVDLMRPSGEAVTIHYEADDGQKVSAYRITEYNACPKLSAEYRIVETTRTEKEIKKNIPPEYEHYLDLTLQLADSEGSDDNLWDGNLFKDQEITYFINGTEYKDTLQDGTIKRTLEADGVEEVTVSVAPKGWNGSSIYYISQPVTKAVVKQPDPVFQPEPDYRPLWAILGVLGAAFLLMLFLWIRKKNTTIIYMSQPHSPGQPDKKVETKSCTYSGKLNLYVVRTKDGRDIPPQTYRLFGRQAGRVTLAQILSGCGIKFGKIGAEDIVIYPGPDHSIILMDQSERCCVLRGAEILRKGMGYPVFYNEKITVTLEDEATEIEVHYKNLKPSERSN